MAKKKSKMEIWREAAKAATTKIGLIADPHFHSPKDQPLRLQTCLKVFNAIAGRFRDFSGLTEAVILGDITHHHGELTPDVLKHVNYALGDLVTDGNLKKLYLMDGNHDIAPDGGSILPAFWREYIRLILNLDDTVVYNSPRLIEPEYAPPIGVIPYNACTDSLMRELTRLDEWEINTVLMHAHFEGAVHGEHEFKPPGGISKKQLSEFKNIKLIVSGHYHKAQTIKAGSVTVEYLGAPMQNDFGEASYEPCFGILEPKGEGYKLFRFATPEAYPRFFIIPYKEGMTQGDLPIDRGYGFHNFRLDVPADVDLRCDTIRSLKKLIPRLKIKVIPHSAEVRTRVEEFLSQQEEEDDYESLTTGLILPKKNPQVELPTVIDVYSALNTSSPEEAERMADVGKELVRAALKRETP